MGKSSLFISNLITNFRLDCKNDGLCMKNGDGISFCKCTLEFSGRWCENQVVSDQPVNNTGSCTPNPCQNNGVCSNEGQYALENQYQVLMLRRICKMHMFGKPHRPILPVGMQMPQRYGLSREPDEAGPSRMSQGRESFNGHC
jgi:hypothetical protein